MKNFILLLLFLFSLSVSYAQTIDTTATQLQDSTNFVQAFKKGKINIGLRYFFMQTNNAQGLADYYANAAGTTLRYQTATYKKFQLTAGVYAIGNLHSSELFRPDSATKQMNRYEVGLFDLTDTLNKKLYLGIDELAVKYAPGKFAFTIGRQAINTPFINQQDGRMKPTAVQGIWAEFNQNKSTKINAAYINQISPRSTSEWYSVGNSIGVYAQGLNVDGTKANYAANLRTKGIFLAGVTHQHNGLKLQLWEQYTENIFNSLLLQADVKHPLNNNLNFVGGAQVIYQAAINNGGNADAAKTYFTKGGQSLAISASAGIENKKWQSSINYTRITAAGRYLMPREWGRDPFYTFMQRERNDGVGDMHAIVAKGSLNQKKSGLQYSLAAGYFHLPSVDNFRLNKYGLPSYYQINTEIKYSFKGFLKGLNLQLLYAYKKGFENVYPSNKYVINKINMGNFNAVVNYRF